MTRVALLGSGNIGHALTALLGSRPDCDVRLWSRRIRAPARWEVTLTYGDRICASGAARAHPHLRRVVDGADVVIVTVPTHARAQVLGEASDHLGACKLLLSWEGSGPFERTLRRLAIRRPIAVGLQRSPIVCQISSYGRAVELLGARSSVVAAATDPRHTDAAARLLRALLPFRLVFSPQYACVSLSPGNPLIHPARMYAYAHRAGKRGAPERFYADWDDAASEVLLALHGELRALRRRLKLPARFIRTMADGPQAPTPAAVTRLIRAEKVLHRIGMPVRVERRAATLDTAHRFFREDIGEGLAHIVDIARHHGADLPTCRAICGWYAGLPQ